jgi:hypothetical protein
MARHVPVAMFLGGLVTVALAMAPALTPAYAHEHPSGLTDLVSPALVRVEATAHAEITLLDHIGQLIHVERSYDEPIGVGSGVVVTPEGALVTLTRVVRSEDDMAILAANKIFAEHHKVKIPADAKRHTLKDPLLNRHLQECYPPKKPTATCIINVTTEITVYPNIASDDLEGFKAEIVHTGDKPDSPAVLMPTGRAEGGNGLPTAPLAAQVPSEVGSPVSVAGFTARPGPTARHVIDIAHLDKGGTTDGGRPFKDPYGKVDEPKKLGALIDKGLLGAPVIGDKDGKVIGLLVGGGDDGRMVGIREVSSALAQAKVTPRRGPIDSAFEVALTRFHTKFYGDAVPAFQRVLELYPGHVVAVEHLKTSQDKRGGPEDEGARAAAPAVAPGAGLPLWALLAGAVALLVAALGGALLLWRRRAGRNRAGAPPPGPFPPGPGAAPVPGAAYPVPAQAPATDIVPHHMPGIAFQDAPEPSDGRPWAANAGTGAADVSGAPAGLLVSSGDSADTAPTPTLGSPEDAPGSPSGQPSGTGSAPLVLSSTPSSAPPAPPGADAASSSASPSSGSPGPAQTGSSGTSSGTSSSGTAISVPPSSVTEGEEVADQTVVVGRPKSFPPVPQAGTEPRPVLVAPPSDRPERSRGEAQQKYCTRCGMRLGPMHRFCGYCGHPAEM